MAPPSINNKAPKDKHKTDLVKRISKSRIQKHDSSKTISKENKKNKV